MSKAKLIWNSNTKCEAYINIANQLVLQFAFHIYLIKIWYTAIRIGKAKCTLCIKLKSFQLFKHFCIANNLYNAWAGVIDVVSTSLAGLTCECEFWSHKPWAEHVPPQTTPAPHVWCHQAWSRSAELWVSRTVLEKGYGQVWGTPALHHFLTYTPGKEWVLWSSQNENGCSHSNWLMIRQADVSIAYQTEFLGSQGSKHTRYTNESEQRGSLTCKTG